MQAGFGGFPVKTAAENDGESEPEQESCEFNEELLIVKDERSCIALSHCFHIVIDA